MELKILEKIKGIPLVVRIIAGVTLIILGVLFSLIPVIPGFLLVIMGLVFLFSTSARKVKKIQRIRKDIVYLFQDPSWKRWKQKREDLKRHIKELFWKKKKR